MHGMNDHQSRHGRKRDDRRISTSQAPRTSRPVGFLNEEPYSPQEGLTYVPDPASAAPRWVSVPQTVPVSRRHLSPQLLASGEETFFLVKVEVKTHSPWEEVLAAMRELITTLKAGASGLIGFWGITKAHGKVVLDVIALRPWVVEKAAKEFPKQREDITTAVCKATRTGTVSRNQYERRLWAAR